MLGTINKTPEPMISHDLAAGKDCDGVWRRRASQSNAASSARSAMPILDKQLSVLPLFIHHDSSYHLDAPDAAFH